MPAAGIGTPETLGFSKWRVPAAGSGTPETLGFSKWRVPAAGSGTPETLGFSKWRVPAAGIGTPETIGFSKWRVPAAWSSTPETLGFSKWRVPAAGIGTSETIGFSKWRTTRGTCKWSRKSRRQVLSGWSQIKALKALSTFRANSRIILGYFQMWLTVFNKVFGCSPGCFRNFRFRQRSSSKSGAEDKTAAMYQRSQHFVYSAGYIRDRSIPQTLQGVSEVIVLRKLCRMRQP